MFIETEKVKQWFWSNIFIDDLGCWVWLKKSYIKHGYCMIKVKKRPILIHRYAWELTYGNIPEGLCVCHKCDNTKCINPEHLFLGTHQENMEDMRRKGRARTKKGEENGRAILTNKDVMDIKNSLSFSSDLELSRRYKIHRVLIYAIRHGKRWKHLTNISTKIDNVLAKDKRITYMDQTKTISQWAKCLKINESTLFSRLHRSKWPIEKALTTNKQNQKIITKKRGNKNERNNKQGIRRRIDTGDH